MRLGLRNSINRQPRIPILGGGGGGGAGFYTDFSGYSVGSLPSEDFGFHRDGSSTQYPIVSDAGFTGGKGIRTDVASASGFTICYIKDTVFSGNDSIFEMRFRPIAPYTTTARFYLGGRLDTVGDTLYYSGLRREFNEVRTWRIASSGYVLQNTANPVAYPVDVWYRAIWQMVGSNIKFKFLQEGGTDPGWIHETSDSTYTTGQPFFWMRQVDVEIDWIDIQPL